MFDNLESLIEQEQITKNEIEEFAKQIRKLTLETTRSLNSLASNRKVTQEEKEEETNQRATLDLIDKQISALLTANRRTEPPTQLPITAATEPPTADLYKQFKQQMYEVQEDIDKTEKVMEMEAQWPDASLPSEEEYEPFHPQVNDELYRKVKNTLLASK